MLEIILKATVIGYVYATILNQPDHILGPFYAWLKRLLSTRKMVKETIELPEEIQRLRGEKYETITRVEVKESKWLKPLGGCELCTAGQLSFWFFLGNKIVLKYFTGYYSTFGEILNLIFIICSTILLTRVLFLAVQRLSK